MKAIVLGGDHHNALGVIRALGRMRVNPDLYLLACKADKPYITSSKYIGETFRFETPDEIGDALLDRFSSTNEKAVIFCCHDALAEMLDRRKGELEGKYFFPHSTTSSVTMLQNKKTMGELALRCGLNIPEDSKEYPLMLKPLNSVSGSKEDILVCRNADQFDEYFKTHTPQNTLVQKYIDKKLEFQLIGCVTFDGKIVIPGYSSILRPCKGSNTSFLRYEALPDSFCDIPSCRKFLQETGFRGLFSMEFLRDAQDRDYFMEINFRNDGNAICVTDSGVNLPYIWYKSCLGEDHDEMLSVVPKSIYVIPEFDEISLRRSRQISFGEMISDFRKADAGMEWDSKDKSPFFALLRRRVSNKLHKK